jgi:hypothetical protein
LAGQLEPQAGGQAWQALRRRCHPRPTCSSSYSPWPRAGEQMLHALMEPLLARARLPARPSPRLCQPLPFPPDSPFAIPCPHPPALPPQRRPSLVGFPRHRHRWFPSHPCDGQSSFISWPFQSKGHIAMLHSHASGERGGEGGEGLGWKVCVQPRVCRRSRGSRLTLSSSSWPCSPGPSSSEHPPRPCLPAFLKRPPPPPRGRRPRVTSLRCNAESQICAPPLENQSNQIQLKSKLDLTCS